MGHHHHSTPKPAPAPAPVAPPTNTGGMSTIGTVDMQTGSTNNFRKSIDGSQGLKIDNLYREQGATVNCSYGANCNSILDQSIKDNNLKMQKSGFDQSLFNGNVDSILQENCAKNQPGACQALKNNLAAGRILILL